MGDPWAIAQTKIGTGGSPNWSQVWEMFRTIGNGESPEWRSGTFVCLSPFTLNAWA